MGWNARYVEEAVEAGRGEVIVLEGNAFLDINLTGVSIPETDEDYAVYYQGGLTWYHAKLGVLLSLQKMLDAGLVTLP